MLSDYFGPEGDAPNRQTWYGRTAPGDDPAAKWWNTVPGQNQTGPAAGQWPAARGKNQLTFQELLKLVYSVSGLRDSAPGGMSGIQDSDFRQGLAMHDSIWGEDQKKDDGMSGMLSGLLSSYKGG